MPSQSLAWYRNLKMRAKTSIVQVSKIYFIIVVVTAFLTGALVFHAAITLGDMPAALVALAMGVGTLWISGANC